MRNISFALTTEQVRNRTKTVTRRVGWASLKPGTLLQPVVKSQGLRKGERVEKIGGPIRVVQISRETVREGLSQSDVAREGFPAWTPAQFSEMFCRTHGCSENTVVTRIEFEYVEAGQ